MVVALIGTILGVTLALLPDFRGSAAGKARKPLIPTLDTNGPYALISTTAATRQYAGALAEARKLHPGANEFSFDPADLQPLATVLQKLQPRYAMVFLLPTELDVNFAWRWLQLSTQLDDDPLVDLRTGFISGTDPAAATALVHRIRTAVESKTPLAGLAVDNLGPNTMAGKTAFYENPVNFMIPVLGDRFGLRTLSHGTEAFDQQRLGTMDGAGLVHFGGHGHPERVDDGVTAQQVKQLKLARCVVFNGACHTGVTGRWFDLRDKILEQQVSSGDSFALALLQNNVLGYLAALHPDHGMPVYQEMEFLATDGATLGDLIKHTHDGVILAAGGKLPQWPSFTNNAPIPQCTPADIMLMGTASRVLFGDPALRLSAPFTEAPFEISSSPAGDGILNIKAQLKNAALKSTFTDTYYSEMSSVPNMFNDRALISCKLPTDWDSVRKVEIAQVTAKGQTLTSRLVGFAVEKEGRERTLHAQVDLPSTAFMESTFRTAGSTVELKVSR